MAALLGGQSVRSQRVLSARAFMRLAPKAGEISESREQGALDAFECLTLSGALMVHSIDLCDDEMLADLREAFSGHLARGAQPQTRAAFLKLHDAAFSFDAPRTLDISINLSRLLVSGLAAAEADLPDMVAYDAFRSYQADLKLLSDPTSKAAHAFETPLLLGNGEFGVAGGVRGRLRSLGHLGRPWIDWIVARENGDAIDWDLEIARVHVAHAFRHDGGLRVMEEVANLASGRRVKSTSEDIGATEAALDPDFITSRLSSGPAPAFGTEAELAARRAARALIADVRGLIAQETRHHERLGMGGNYPPEDMRFRYEDVAAVTTAAGAIDVELAKPKPDLLEIVRNTSRLKLTLVAGLAAVSGGYFNKAGADLYEVTVDGTVSSKLLELSTLIGEWLALVLWQPP